MSCLQDENRVEPSDSRVNRVSTISIASVTKSQLNVAIDNIFKLNPPDNRCETFFKGNPATPYGRVKQFLKNLVIIMLPVLLLTGLIASTFISTLSNYSKSSKVRRTLLYSVELGRLIHYLQEERDISALYLSSIEEKTKLLLLERYAATDQSLEELTFWTIGPSLIRNEFQSKEKFLTYLNKHRYELSTLKMSIVNELELYTTLIRVFITWLYDAVTEEQSGSIWRSLVAYQEVVIAKEYMGLERALGTIYYSTGHFSSVEVYLLFKESQDVANATFLSAKRYSDLVHDLYEKNFEEDQVLHTAQPLMPTYVRRNESVKMAQWWFNNKTIYMNLLLETQSELALEITEMLDERQEQNINKVAVTSAIFFCVFILSVTISFAIFSLTDEIQTYFITLAERSATVTKEAKRTDILMYKMVPKVVAESLRLDRSVEAQNYRAVTIFYCDIQKFTNLSICCPPASVINMINRVYMSFDNVIAKYDVYKMESIGDSIMVVSGAPEPQDNEHVTQICSMALDLVEMHHKMKFPFLPTTKLKLRTGIHTGPVLACVIGSQMLRYCLFGETVTIAAKMESLGKSGKIHISETTYDGLVHSPRFQMDERVDGLIMELETMTSLSGRSRTFWLHRTGDNRMLSSSSSRSSLSSNNKDEIN